MKRERYIRLRFCREYSSWSSMIRRCIDPKCDDFRNYGGRGITVCQRWTDSFEAFLMDVGERPVHTTLDRINNDGNYEPGNVRWADRWTQAHNKRPPGAKLPKRPITPGAQRLRRKREVAAREASTIRHAVAKMFGYDLSPAGDPAPRPAKPLAAAIRAQLSTFVAAEHASSVGSETPSTGGVAAPPSVAEADERREVRGPSGVTKRAVHLMVVLDLALCGFNRLRDPSAKMTIRKRYVDCPACLTKFSEMRAKSRQRSAARDAALTATHHNR